MELYAQMINLDSSHFNYKFLQCPYADCGKIYGSEGSLNLHIKIKHNGGNKTEREKTAVSAIYKHYLPASFTITCNNKP